MTIAVTGTSGHLGALTVHALLDRGVPAGGILALARDPHATDLPVEARRADYDDPASLLSALDGVDTLLLVSGDEIGRRVQQHTNVIEAAKAAGVRRVVYTSAPRADTTALPVAPEHRATEEVLRSSGLSWTILRNNWYTENYTDRLAEFLDSGEILSATGTGRIGAAARADYAGAAAAVLTTEGHEQRVYELGGEPVDYAALAAAITEVTGRPVTHRSVSADELAAILRGFGLDEGTAGFVAALDTSIANGDLDLPAEDLPRLLGRPATPVADTVREAHLKI